MPLLIEAVPPADAGLAVPFNARVIALTAAVFPTVAVVLSASSGLAVFPLRPVIALTMAPTIPPAVLP